MPYGGHKGKHLADPVTAFIMWGRISARETVTQSYLLLRSYGAARPFGARFPTCSHGARRSCMPCSCRRDPCLVGVSCAPCVSNLRDQHARDRHSCERRGISVPTRTIEAVTASSDNGPA